MKVTEPTQGGNAIGLLVSDVDGTLVTDKKTLTARTKAAVESLRANNIAFAIISSRPPRGLRMLIERLAIRTPVAGFNGGVLTTPGLSIIAQHLLSPAAARQAVDMINAHGAQAWIFCGQDWLVRDPEGPYVGLEGHTIGFRPTIVGDFGRALDSAAKIVGVSKNFELLSRLEHDVRAKLADWTTVTRSQSYYVDVTHPLANKGIALAEIAKLMAVPMAKVVVIGDGGNDVAMFKRSGLSIAMDNASPEVQRSADFVTDSNNQEGFARAVEWFVLGGNRSNAIASDPTAGSSRSSRGRATSRRKTYRH
jgi:Cof subfamily protein (haloacid dehalogenase superfamily)